MPVEVLKDRVVCDCLGVLRPCHLRSERRAMHDPVAGGHDAPFRGLVPLPGARVQDRHVRIV